MTAEVMPMFLATSDEIRMTPRLLSTLDLESHIPLWIVNVLARAIDALMIALYSQNRKPENF
jgi:hypothetical protein